MTYSANSLASHYDTIVVGAGPAGIMAAVRASQRGSVLIIDSSTLPRDKSCGGMLNEDTQAFLEHFGPMPDEMFLDPKWVNFRFHDWDRRIRKVTQLRFANVDRKLFDHWLTSLLPDTVTLQGGAQFIGVEQYPGGVRVKIRSDGDESTLECSALIGCDGARSAVRRALGASPTPVYVTLQDYCTLEGEIEPYFDCIYMRHIGDSFGYAYVVPKGKTAIVGSVFYPRTKHPAEKHEEVLATLRAKLPLGESSKREPWVALSVRGREDVMLGHGRVLLAGEAGGFMSPTSGEGISYALRTGYMAGDAVAIPDLDSAVAAYRRATAPIVTDIVRRLRWLPIMESPTGKYVAGFVPTPIVSRITQGL